MSGVAGVNIDGDCRQEITDGAGIIQPRGDEWAGFAAVQGQEIVREADKGKITPLLEMYLPKLEIVSKMIIHVNQSPKNPQPARIEKTAMGPIALAFDGKIINQDELLRKSPYLNGSEASIISRLVAAGKDPLDGIKNVYENVKGPFSLVLLTLDGVFAARDVLGIRPMTVGRFYGDDKIGCAVASESACLEHIGMETIRDVRPGEIISIEPHGFKTIERVPSPGLIICGFEYAYWARPSTIIEDIWVGEVRRSAGRKLATDCPKVDIVSAFPMSGIAAAEGFAQAASIPYQSIFDFNIEAGGRSFLPFSSEKRAKRAKNKLLPMPWAIMGKIVEIIDDSIVEGNQTLRRIHIVKKAGAKEIHLAIETPLMKYPCPFDLTPRGELMAAHHTVEEIRKILGVESLRFNTVEDFAEAILVNQSEKRKKEDPVKLENICLGCFTGEFPQYLNR